MITTLTDKNKTVVLEKPPSGADVAKTIVSDDWTYSWVGNTLRRTRRGLISDGSYANATIVVKDGLIQSITTGKPTLAAPPELCFDTPAAIRNRNTAVNADVANLTVQTPTGLLTHFYIEGDDTIEAVGAGTANDRVRIKWNGTEGATVNKCGYKIKNGLVAAWVDPVTEITTSDPLLKVERTGCSYAISTVVDSTIFPAGQVISMHMRPCNAGFVPSVALAVSGGYRAFGYDNASKLWVMLGPVEPLAATASGTAEGYNPACIPDTGGGGGEGGGNAAT